MIKSCSYEWLFCAIKELCLFDYLCVTLSSSNTKNTLSNLLDCNSISVCYTFEKFILINVHYYKSLSGYCAKIFRVFKC